MCEDNRYGDDLRILTAIELYLNSNVFSNIDTILAILVSHSALDSNKTNTGSK